MTYVVGFLCAVKTARREAGPFASEIRSVETAGSGGDGLACLRRLLEDFLACRHLVHADDLRFEIAPENDMGGPARLGNNRAIATLVSVTPEDAESLDLKVTAVRTLLRDTEGGASRIGEDGKSKLVVRIAAPSSYLLRKQLIPVIRLFLGDHAMPKVWNL